MKTLIFSIAFVLFTVSTVFGQGKIIQPLRCGTWGEEDWSIYTEEDLARKVYPGPVDLEAYNEYYPSNKVLFLARNYDGYVNNVQAIRWSLEAEKEPYWVTISENHERIIVYEAQTRGCGLIFFPDSLLKYKTGTLEIVVEQKGEPMLFITFDAERKTKRRKILSELQGAGPLNQQVGILLQKQKYREALSLLEIERWRNPDDETLRTLYWRTLSRIRLCPLQYPTIGHNLYPEYSTPHSPKPLHWCGTSPYPWSN